MLRVGDLEPVKDQTWVHRDQNKRQDPVFTTYLLPLEKVLEPQWACEQVMILYLLRMKFLVLVRTSRQVSPVEQGLL